MATKQERYQFRKDRSRKHLLAAAGVDLDEWAREHGRSKGGETNAQGETNSGKAR